MIVFRLGVSAIDNGIETLPFDVKKLEDPSLIIYHPVRVDGPTTIVTNGDQTDTLKYTQSNA